MRVLVGMVVVRPGLMGMAVRVHVLRVDRNRRSRRRSRRGVRRRSRRRYAQRVVVPHPGQVRMAVRVMVMRSPGMRVDVHVSVAVIAGAACASVGPEAWTTGQEQRCTEDQQQRQGAQRASDHVGAPPYRD